MITKWIIGAFSPMITLAFMAQTSGPIETKHWLRVQASNPTQGGPVTFFGVVSWSSDGSTGKCSIYNVAPPKEFNEKNDDFLDISKYQAKMKRLETPGFELEYITVSNQVSRVGCRVGIAPKDALYGAINVYFDHYEPGKGYRIFRNGILLHQEFFDPQPTPPEITIKELARDQVEWQVRRAPKLKNYFVRVSWDEGQTWVGEYLENNQVVLNLEESRRNPGVPPWIEFQIAQGLVITAKRYVMGKGFVPAN